MLKQIEEERAHLEIQMQTCLEEAKNKKEEEGRSQPVRSCSVPSTDQQKKAEHEVRNCEWGVWAEICFQLFFFYRTKSSNCQFEILLMKTLFLFLRPQIRTVLNSTEVCNFFV